MCKKVLFVFGTRPEAIKMAPLIHCLKENPKQFDVSVCVTAQHRDMLDEVVKLFEIEVDIDLDIMKTGQDLFDVTTSVLSKMREVLQCVQPDFVLVHGDTTTCLAASLAAFYTQSKVVHVEAGLRTHNLDSPFPEELNRQLVGRIARYHIAPTLSTKINLEREGIDPNLIEVAGNTVIDALMWMLDKIESDQGRLRLVMLRIEAELGFDVLSAPYILVTGHRRENFGRGFHQICDALKKLAEIYPNMNFVYPVHLNPNVQEPVKNLLNGIDNIKLIKPQSYEVFVLLMRHCYLILTDSGGIQEEGPSIGKPVLVTRDTTERPEAVSAGTVKLVGSSSAGIVRFVSELIDDPVAYQNMSAASNPYGDGTASSRIAEFLARV